MQLAVRDYNKYDFFFPVPLQCPWVLSLSTHTHQPVKNASEKIFTDNFFIVTELKAVVTLVFHQVKSSWIFSNMTISTSRFSWFALIKYYTKIFHRDWVKGCRHVSLPPSEVLLSIQRYNHLNSERFLRYLKSIILFTFQIFQIGLVMFDCLKLRNEFLYRWYRDTYFARTQLLNFFNQLDYCRITLDYLGSLIFISMGFRIKPKYFHFLDGVRRLFFINNKT